MLFNDKYITLSFFNWHSFWTSVSFFRPIKEKDERSQEFSLYGSRDVVECMESHFDHIPCKIKWFIYKHKYVMRTSRADNLHKYLCLVIKPDLKWLYVFFIFSIILRYYMWNHSNKKRMLQQQYRKFYWISLQYWYLSS